MGKYDFSLTLILLKCWRFLSTRTKSYLRTVEPGLCRDFNLKGKIKKFCAGGVRLDPENAIIKRLKLIFYFQTFWNGFHSQLQKKMEQGKGRKCNLNLFIVLPSDSQWPTLWCIFWSGLTTNSNWVQNKDCLVFQSTSSFLSPQSAGCRNLIQAEDSFSLWKWNPHK